jgi:predicted nuclease of predicted toxin-antitoxin system
VSLLLVIDMNLSPDWVGWFEDNGWSAIHWSTVGDPRAPDRAILDWARHHARVVFTHDLDFGAVLASSGAVFPSVIQLRANDVTPSACGALVLEVLTSFKEKLEQGALVTVDEDGRRVRLLPLGVD